MREKLIELISQAQDCGCDVTDVVEMNYVENDALADHLIANDVVPVVRCKDCESCFPNLLRNGEVYFYKCDFHDIEVEKDDFCSYGERKGDGNG